MENMKKVGDLVLIKEQPNIIGIIIRVWCEEIFYNTWERKGKIEVFWPNKTTDIFPEHEWYLLEVISESWRSSKNVPNVEI